MSARVLVTVGGKTALPVLAGLMRLPVDVWAAAPAGNEGLLAGVRPDRRLALDRLGARDGGEEILEMARRLRIEAVLPTGDVDLRAVSELGWVFDLRGVAVAAPASWSLDACADSEALRRAWTASGRAGSLRGTPGAETWWDVVADRQGALRWIQTRGAGAGREALVRVARAVQSLGIRYAASFCMKVDDDGLGELVQVVPRFNGALAPVMARGINLPRILLEVLLDRDVPRVEGAAPSTWAASGATALA